LAATVEVAWEIIELRHLKRRKTAVVRRSKPDAAAAIAGPTGNASASLADYPHQLRSRQMLFIWHLDFSGPSPIRPSHRVVAAQLHIAQTCADRCDCTRNHYPAFGRELLLESATAVSILDYSHSLSACILSAAPAKKHRSLPDIQRSLTVTRTRFSCATPVSNRVYCF
jgi:hypothetical protein